MKTISPTQLFPNAPSAYRIPFDETTSEINGKVKRGIVDIEAALLGGDDGRLRETVTTVTRDIQRLMDRSSAIINGDYGKEQEIEVVTLDQDDIDALFD